MNRFVKSTGGNLVRIGQAIDGFKTKYGYWPTALQIDAETLDMGSSQKTENKAR